MWTQGVHLKGVLPSLVRWHRRAGTKEISCLGPVQNFFFLTVHYIISFILIAQQAEHAVVPCRLSLNMCLCPPF
jgi:hypothetical protein